jgi:hypothetical protein
MSNGPRQRGSPARRKQIIADAVHQGVLLVTGGDAASRSCPLYASAGALLLGHLTCQRWAAQAGAAQWGTGADLDHPAGEMCFAFDPNATGPAQSMIDGITVSRGGLAAGEFHCWAVRGDAAARVIEIADFWARHVPTQSALAGYPWLRGPMPLVWDSLERVEAQRFRYRPDAAATARLQEFVRYHRSLIADTASAALWALETTRAVAVGHVLGSPVHPHSAPARDDEPGLDL